MLFEASVGSVVGLLLGSAELVILLICSEEHHSTVARTVNYPKQDTTIHTTAETQPWAATIGGKSNQANQHSNRSFPNGSGEHGSSSAATATPSQCLYKSLA